MQPCCTWLPVDPLPPTLGMAPVGRNSTFPQHGHVAYQTKDNQDCSTMVANILPEDPPADPRDGSIGPKFNFFTTWSCCISS